MTINSIMLGLEKVISDDAIVMCVGERLCGENRFVKKKGLICCVDISFDYLSIALGIAIGTEKRVVILCEDNYLLKHLNSICQIGISECTNLYVLTFRTNTYSSTIKHKTLTDAVRSIKGVLFNFGVLVHEYTPYFKDNYSIKNLIPIFDKSLGPLVAMIDVDSSRIYNKGVLKTSWNDLKEFL